MIPLEHIPKAYLVGGTDAIAPMYNYYPVARKIYSILTPEFIALEDTPAGSWGLAWFYGLDVYNRPRFAVRDDVALNTKIAWHESSHAFEAMCTNLLMQGGKSSSYFRDKYWAFRQFPGTWQEADAYALSIGGPGAWQFYVAESIAEAGSAAVGGVVESEWTAAYGKDLATFFSGGNYDPYLGGLKAREFFVSLMREVENDMTPEQDLILRRVLALLEAEGPKIWTARSQRFLDVETGKVYDPNIAPVDSRIKT